MKGKLRGKRSITPKDPDTGINRLMVRFKDPANYRRLAAVCASEGRSMNEYVESLILETLDIQHELNQANPYLAVTEERRTPDAPSSGTNQS